MSLSDKNKKIVFIILSVIIIAGLVYYFLKKKKVKEKVAIISASIVNGIGALGTDVDMALSNVAAASYMATERELLLMNDSDADEIIKAFVGKTKSQIKKMVADYQSRYGKKFNDHLNDEFDHWYGYDSDSYAKVLNTINSAR